MTRRPRRNPEIVGHGVTVITSYFGQGFSEEIENCFGKVVESGMVVIVGDVFVHDAP